MQGNIRPRAAAGPQRQADGPKRAWLLQV